ncbi:MAG: phospho-N-acetylmuramoyl-pentapeptide-transferase [Acidimicrobiales bacterium]|nr:phospho-N-acetylmuramoyl-pentapeptide-transferase [Acidimicrobiales bacterium]
MIRLLTAAGMAFAFSAFGTRFLIDILTRNRIGQPIREDGPEGHHIKAGTPTMGGIAIVGGAFSSYFLSHLLIGGIFTRSGLLAIGAISGAGIVGFMDDWLKVSKERNLGLNKRAKMFGLLAVAFGFAIGTQLFTSTRTELSFTRYTGLDLGPYGWIFWAVLLIIGCSNAVNLTDGLDGLAAGSGIFSFAAYVLIGFWIFRQAGARAALYDVPHALDLAVVAIAMVGALAGFLWFNAAPAEIFMGDTGSLAIGTGLAALALLTNTHLLLPIIGGVYVAETLSVIFQVGYFKFTNGSRLFRMAPVHHHFELKGWPETKVIVRFWLISGGLMAVALGLFYADWVGAVEFQQ